MADKAQLSLWIELTEACQYKCRFCYNYWRDIPSVNHVSMPDQTAVALISFLERCNTSFHTTVALAGGDPTAHPNFRELARRIAAQARNVTVVTHGGNLSADELIALSRLANVSVQFSIPSLNRDRYRFLTGGGNLDRVMTALLMCRELSIPVSLSVVVTLQNSADLSDVILLAAEVAADDVIANRFLASGRGALYDEKFAITADAFEEALAAAGSLARARGVGLMASGFDPNIRLRKAAEPKLTISTDGKIRLCSLVPDAVATLETDPIELIKGSAAFWASAKTLEGCICASQPHLT